MSVSDLCAAVHAAGIPCDVEARGRLAIVIVSASTAHAFADRARRDQLAALGRRHGFTHVAVEVLADRSDRAALPGD
jgi:hypothetical protein